jgi:hypothetical protein
VVFERWVTPADAELDLLRARQAELTARQLTRINGQDTTSAESDSTLMMYSL